MLAFVSMRAVAVLLLLAACGRSSDAGPQWPKPSEKDSDGGESIAPHVARGASGATTPAADDDDDDAKDDADVKPTTVATEKAVEKAADKPAAPASDDTLFDELTIEFEDE